MTWDRGRPGRHHAGPWLFGLGAWLLVLLLLLAPTPAGARQPTTYAQCLRTYSARTDAAAYCRRLFPATAPSSRISATAARPVSTVGGATTTAPPPPTTPPSTTGQPTPYQACVAATGRTAEARKLCAQRHPGSAPPGTPAPTTEPIDVTKPVNTWLDDLFSRPKTPTTPPSTPPRTPPRTPTDPLAVIPDIQAACATWADNPARWRRCTADGWREAGLSGAPPLVLQTPPRAPPVVQPPPAPPPVRPEPPTQRDPSPPPPRRDPPPVVAPPVEAPPIEAPVATVPTTPVAQPPPPIVSRSPEPPPQPPPPTRPATAPIWAWIVALVVAVVVAAGGGFGLAKLLERAKLRARARSVAPISKPDIALVADPGLVVLEADGPPRSGLAVSLRCTRAPGSGEVRLDYPLLESTP